MKKRISSLLLVGAMLLSLLPMAALAEEGPTTSENVGETTNVAKIGATEYPTLADAVKAAESGQTITLLQDAEGDGVMLTTTKPKNITIDLGGFTYTFAGSAVGSTGTETQGFHFEEGNTVTVTNGTLNAKSKNDDFMMLIQNYCDLTLDGVTVDGTNLNGAGSGRYVVSNNCGNVTIKNSTITAATGDFAFDSCKFSSYDAPTVTVTNSTITGKVEATGGSITLGDGTTLNGQLRVGENKGSGNTYGGATKSVVTIGSGATVNNSGKYAVVVFGPQKLNVEGTVNGIIGTNGNAYNAGSVINIKDGAKVTEENDVAIYMPNGTLNISGGEVSGTTAVYFKSTALNITGGTLTGTGTDAAYEYNGDGCEATGDALVIDSCNYPSGLKSEDVKISGGTFTSTQSDTVAVAAFTSQGATPVTNFITGGTFSDLSALQYAADGAKINIQLIADVTTGSVAVPANGTVKLNGNGKTITLTDRALFNNSGLDGITLDGIGKNAKIQVSNATIVSNTKQFALITSVDPREQGAVEVTFDSCTFKNMYAAVYGNTMKSGDSVKLTIENSTYENCTYGLSLEKEDGWEVTFTNNKMLGETAVQELFSNTAYITEPTVEISDGYYSVNPTAYVGDGYAAVQNTDEATETVYAWTVEKYTAPEAPADMVIEADPVAAVSGTLADNKKDAANSACTALTSGDQKIEISSDPVEAAATTVANKNTVEKTEATRQLNAALNSTTAEEKVAIVIQTYTDVEVTGVELDGENIKSITYDIKPMAQTVATTTAVAAEVKAGSAKIVTKGNDQNAVEIGSPKELDVTATTTVTIPLPDDFVNQVKDNTAWVKHVKSTDEVFYYQGKIVKNDTKEEYAVTFENPNGFSEFTVMSTLNTVASVTQNGSTVYFEKLQSAVDYVKDGGTVTLTADNAGTATVERDVTFTFKTNDKIDGAINAGANTTKTTKTEDPDTYTFDYTAPTSGGGGSTRTVTVTKAENGKVTADKTSPAKGSTVTLTVTPDEGYTLDTLTVTDSKGNEIELTKVNDTTYTYTMPSGTVKVTPTFVAAEETPEPEPTPTPSTGRFVDVNDTDYFNDPVDWAADKGITTGKDDTHFAPNDPCTRAQIVTFLWRAAGSPAPESETCPFTDVDKDAYYYDAVLWAVEKGITKGMTDTSFGVDNTCTRGQAVTFLHRYEGSQTASAENPFDDVQDSDFFCDAVLWANENNVTNGTSANTFSPAKDCTRGQIVTFLYRDMAE